MRFGLVEAFDRIRPAPKIDLEKLTRVVGGCSTQTFRADGVISDGVEREQNNTYWYELAKTAEGKWEILWKENSSMSSSDPLSRHVGVISNLEYALITLRAMSEELKKDNPEGFRWDRSDNNLANVERAIRLKKKGMLPEKVPFARAGGTGKPRLIVNRTKPLSGSDRLSVRPLIRRVK